MKSPEFMTDTEIMQYFQTLSASGETAVLERVAGERSIIDWLENIQTEKDWRMIRIYLHILEESAEHLTPQRRQIALDIFYEMLFHQNGTVRIMVAQTAGHLIALCGENIGEVWESYLRRILFPDTMIEEKQKNQTAYTLRVVLTSILEKTNIQDSKKILSIYEAYFKSCRWGEQVCINLLSGILELPHTMFTNLQKHEIFGFARQILSFGGDEVRALSTLLMLKWLDDGWKPQEDEKRYLERLQVRSYRPYCENYLRRQIRYNLSKTENEQTELTPEKTSVLLQKNLHLDTLWVSKVVQLEIVKRRFLGLSRSSKEAAGNLFQYATHLLNVLCMNTDAVVFRCAGEDLVQMVPRLEEHQKYEIFQEALKEIEMGMDSSNYIPSFLGRTFFYLTSDEQKDVVNQFESLLGSRGEDLVRTVLEVICEILKNDDACPEEEKSRLIGLLCRGMFSYVPKISGEAFYLVGTRIFTLPEKITKGMEARYFGLAKNTMIFWKNNEQQITALWPSLVFHNVSSWLSAHSDAADKNHPDKIAFFSGSFDPFSEKDKAIVQEIRNMGFSVYLYIHEFAWYKNTQPAHIRRQIVYLSTADLAEVTLFPENVTINTNNEKDMERLKALFPGKEIYIVAERDDIEINENYWKEGGENAICNFPHIIFEGNQDFGQMDSVALRQLIRARSIFLQLPSRYRDFSSGLIQQRIIAGKKINEYVDPQVQSLILDWGLYRDKPVFKKAAHTKPIDRIICYYDKLQDMMQERKVLFDGQINADSRDTFVVITDGRFDGAICGVASFRKITLNELFRECSNFDMVSAIREQVSGELLLLTGIYGEDTEKEDYRKIVLQEMLAYCQRKPYSYMLQLRRDQDFDEGRLSRAGFLPVEGYPECRILDMRHCTVLFMDTVSVLRDPYDSDPEVLKVIRKSQERLEEAVNHLYPGMLILGIQTDILNHQLIGLIRKDNNCTDNMPEGKLGEKVYAPFGKILKGVRIPNTITKELNTEKIYASDLSDFVIREFPEYPSLISQIRNIRSFAKPIVFVDDIYHKGYRIHQIGKLLADEHMEIGHMITGVVSGRGQNLAATKGISIDAVHTVPNMSAWILESDMYPFVGGDGIETQQKQESHMKALPSINFVLPYQMPSFMKNASAEAIFRLSKVCLENALELYQTLERVYQARTHRSLTLDRLGEVISEPRYPDSIGRVESRDVKISEYILEEQKKLKRLERMQRL